MYYVFIFCKRLAMIIKKKKKKTSAKITIVVL